MAGFFWLLVALVAYVYVGYPAFLHVWSRLRPRALRMGGPADVTPGVSIIIAARNEGHRLMGRIENLLNLDYPSEARQIIVVSDGSTDDTIDVLERQAAVDAVVLPAGGKALALNAGVDRARFGLLVFADARQAFAPDALRALVAPFRDPHVGAVSGELVLDGEVRDRRGPFADRRRIVQPVPADAERRARGDRRLAVQSTITEGVGLYWR